MARKVVTITVERERVLIVRRREALIRGWCERCAGVVEFVPADATRPARAGAHRAAALDGSVLICLPSLLRRAAGRIFAVGMLLYGKEASWGEVRRWVRDG